MTMAKVAKKYGKQEQRKGDARIGHYGSRYKVPQRVLSTLVAFNTSPICPTAPFASQGSHVVSRHTSRRQVVLA
jgi:hypothetical protein